MLAAAFPKLGIGFAGIALAFGLTLLTMAYTIGPISGCHINPAVTFGLWLGKRFPGRDVLPYWIAQVAGAVVARAPGGIAPPRAGYWIAQVAGAVVAAGILYAIASGKPGFVAGQFASNGYGALSPGGYRMTSALIAEIVLIFVFFMVILGATDRRAPVGFAGIAIGLALTLIHLVCIPIDNTSVNLARSTGPAIFAGAAELSQLWLFWVAPLIGGAIAGLLYPLLFGEEVSAEPIVGEA